MTTPTPSGPVRRPVRVHVAATGNAFMTDLAMSLRDAAAISGWPSELVTDRLPEDPGAINLAVAPHELYSLSGATADAIARATLVGVPVCTEQPGTAWFGISAAYCRAARSVFDINAHGAAAMVRMGIPARHLRLGATPEMIGMADRRDLDVVFLGGETPRRNVELARLAPVLADRHCDLRLFRIDTPVNDRVPGLAFGAEKHALLARAKVLVNIHRDDRRPGYFEWLRMVEAMANGCVVLTEPSSGYEPLQPGIHFVESDDLPGALDLLLDDDDRLELVGAAARDAVLHRWPLAATLGPLLDDLNRAAAVVTPTSSRYVRRRLPSAGAVPRPLLAAFKPAATQRERVFAAMLAEQALRRDIDAVRAQVQFGSSDAIEERVSSGFRASCADGAAPEVSVIVTVFNYASVVGETLESIAASSDVAIEVVVVDDHSTDDSRDVVARLLVEHPDVPMLLLGCEANRGLPAARNLGIARARADKIMVMDADNLVHAACLRRLADALDADPGAAFAYATLEAFGATPGLRSQLDWHVPWLCRANYIDAQAMVRRSTFERYGGYLDDPASYGWEDWDLWLRLAAAGERGVHVREMLGRYRTTPTSMLSITNLAPELLLARLRERHPGVPWPADPGADATRRRPGRGRASRGGRRLPAGRDVVGVPRRPAD